MEQLKAHIIDLLSLYLADCQLEDLEYNDSTYTKAIEIGKILNMPEAYLER